MERNRGFDCRFVIYVADLKLLDRGFIISTCSSCSFLGLIVFYLHCSYSMQVCYFVRDECYTMFMIIISFFVLDWHITIESRQQESLFAVKWCYFLVIVVHLILLGVHNLSLLFESPFHYKPNEYAA